MKNIFFILILTGYSQSLFAQLIKESSTTTKSVYTIRGDYYFDHHNYVKAVENYRMAVKQIPNDVHSMLQTAEAYHRSNMDKEASDWYAKAFDSNPDLEDKYVLKYILSLFRSYNYEEQNKWLAIYNERIARELDKEGVNSTYSDSTLHLIKNLKSVNSKQSEISPVWFNDELIFTSDRDQHHKLYSAVLSPKIEYEQLQLFNDEVNAHVNGVSISIAENANQLFYTTAADELFYYTLVKDAANREINKLEIPKVETGIKHVAVNSNETLLIFTSSTNDKGLDLFKSEFNGKKWSKPSAINVNTSSNELYPTLHNDSVLYFASDRPGGNGGLDIYRVNITENNASVQHLDFPINTSSNDFGLFLRGDLGIGYLSSNRPGGNGDNDIYKLYIEDIKIKNTSEKRAQSYDKTTTKLSMFASNGDIVSISSKLRGDLEFEFLPDVEYKLIINKDDYKTKTLSMNDDKIGEMKLRVTDIYKFHVQDLINTMTDQSDETRKVQDIHINPGDLITFEFIPKVEDFSTNVLSRIRLGNKEVAIDGKHKLVFGYVAQEAIKPSELADNKLSPTLIDDLEEELVIAQQIVDTTYLTKIYELVIAESVDKSNQALSTDSIAATNAQEAKQIVNANQNNLDSTLIEPVTTQLAVIPPETTTPILLENTELLATNNNTGDSITAITKSEEDIMSVSQDSLIVEIILDQKAIDTLTEDSVVTNTNVELEVNDTSTESLVLIANNEMDSTIIENDNAIEKNLTDRNALIAANIDSITANIAQDTTLLLATNTIEYDTIKNANSELESENTIIDSLIVDNSMAQMEPPTTVQDENTTIENESNETIVSNITTPEDKIVNYEKMNPIASNKATIMFRVQIAAARSELSQFQLDRIYKGTNEVQSFTEDGYYKYYITESPDYLEAKRVMKESSVNDAFIAAYRYGTKLNLVKAIAMQRGDETAIISQKIEEQNDTTNKIETPVLDETTIVAKHDEVPENNVEKDSLLILDITSTNIPELDNLQTSSESAEDVQSSDTTSLEELASIQEQLTPRIDSITLQSQLVAVDDNAAIAPNDSLNTNNDKIAIDEGDIKNTQLSNSTDSLHATMIQDSIELEQDDQVKPNEIDSLSIKIDSSTYAIDSTTMLAKEIYDGDSQQDIKQANTAIKNEIVSEKDVITQKPTKSIYSDNFVYRVQIAAARTEISSIQLKQLYKGDRAVNYFEEAGYYKYYVAETDSYFEAEQILKTLPPKSAFVAAYKGEEKWSIEDALAKQYVKSSQHESRTTTDSVTTVVTVNFEFDEFQLNEDQLDKLKKLAISPLISDTTIYVIVNGYTDSQGSKIYNYALSQERAHFVQQLMIKNGIDAERVLTHHFGESQLAKYCPDNEICDESVHRANRRAEILLMMKK